MFSNMSVPPYRAGWGDSQAEGFWERKKFKGCRQKGWGVRQLADGKMGVGWVRRGAATPGGVMTDGGRWAVAPLKVVMTRIELTMDEQLLLAQVLERRIRDLEIEILRTERGEFKAALRERLGLLRQILKRVMRPEVALAA
jgi:hypothetical protein